MKVTGLKSRTVTYTGQKGTMVCPKLLQRLVKAAAQRSNGLSQETPELYLI